MKKLNILLITAAFIFSAAACGKQNASPEMTAAQSAVESTTESKTGEGTASKSAAQTSGREKSGKTGKKVARDGAVMQTDDPSMPTRVIENGTKINIHFGDTVIPGVLNDSETAQALIAKLPYTVHMNSYSHDFCGVTEELPYNEEEVHWGWLNGDIDYAIDAPYFTILHSDEDVSERYDYQVNIGVITCELEKIRSLSGSYDVMIELAENADSAPEEAKADIKAADAETAEEEKNNGMTVAAAAAMTDSKAVLLSAGAENYTKYTDYIPVKATAASITKGSNDKVLVAYFSRSGNTAVEGVDAVSSASLAVNADGTTLGNAEQMARWIAEETGGDLFLIQTEYTYPVDYDRTVKVGEGQDKDGYHPALSSHVENMAQYDTVYLVYPIWHYTLSVPTCAFLDEYDLSGKTIYAFAANAGSRFADSIAKIKAAEPAAEIIEGIALSEREIAGGKDTVLAFVREHMPSAKEAAEVSANGSAQSVVDESATESAEKEAAKAPAAGSATDSMTANETAEENKEMKMMIGDTEVSVAWEGNASVEALKELAAEGPLSVSMSMYGGFEQVGSLGTGITRNDSQTTTQAGDIVLYSGNQIVIFYGSNSWAYTRLGHITDRSASEMADLLGHGDVTVRISME